MENVGSKIKLISNSETFGGGSYHSQDLKKLWSFDKYSQNYRDVRWSWDCLPFSDNLSGTDNLRISVKKKLRDISILEVGSAMGAAYGFLKGSSLVDVSQYTGIEVSENGSLRLISSTVINNIISGNQGAILYIDNSI